MYYLRITSQICPFFCIKKAGTKETISHSMFTIMVKSWCRLVCLSGKKTAAPLSKVFLTSSFSIFIGMKLLSPISTTAHTKRKQNYKF